MIEVWGRLPFMLVLMLVSDDWSMIDDGDDDKEEDDKEDLETEDDKGEGGLQ